MQSSGVGNCINMLSLTKNCRFPLLTLVTMRGEWGEFNPWQVPMGTRRPQAGARTDGRAGPPRRATRRRSAQTVAAAARLAFDSDRAVAVLLSQRLIGAKRWVK